MLHKLDRPYAEIIEQLTCCLCMVGIFYRIWGDWIIKFCQILIIQHLSNALRLFCCHLCTIISYISCRLLKRNGQCFLWSVILHPACRKKHLLVSQDQYHWNQKCNQNTLPLFQILFSDHRPAIGDRCHCGYQHQIDAFITESCCAQTYKDQSCNLFLWKWLRILYGPHQFCQKKHQKYNTGCIRNVLLHHRRFHREELGHADDAQCQIAEQIRRLPSFHQQEPIGKGRQEHGKLQYQVQEKSQCIGT